MVRNVKHLYILSLCVVSLSAFNAPAAFASPASSSDAGRDASYDRDSGSFVASRSDAVPAPEDLEEPEEVPEWISKDLEEVQKYIDSLDKMDDSDVFKNILAEVTAIHDTLSGPGLATPSDAQGLPEDEEVPEESDIRIADDAGVYSLLSLPDHDCVWYTGRFDNQGYTLVFPAAYYSQLNVAENGVLYNLSANSITGRLFTGDTFDSSDYEYKTFTLYPVFGNSANQVYNYRSLSYMTRYYLGSYDRLTSTNTYGDFLVEDVELKRSLNVEYRTYYVAVSCLFFLGVLILCLWKNCRP